jgi:hypothetical protein
VSPADTATVLGQFPLQQLAFDRGGSYHDELAFDSYLGAVGTKRRTALSWVKLIAYVVGCVVCFVEVGRQYGHDGYVVLFLAGASLFSFGIADQWRRF